MWAYIPLPSKTSFVHTNKGNVNSLIMKYLDQSQMRIMFTPITVNENVRIVRATSYGLVELKKWAHLPLNVLEKTNFVLLVTPRPLIPQYVQWMRLPLSNFICFSSFPNIYIHIHIYVCVCVCKMIYYKVNNLNFVVKDYTTWAKAIVLIHSNIVKSKHIKQKDYGT